MAASFIWGETQRHNPTFNMGGQQKFYISVIPCMADRSPQGRMTRWICVPQGLEKPRCRDPEALTAMILPSDGRQSATRQDTTTRVECRLRVYMYLHFKPSQPGEPSAAGLDGGEAQPWSMLRFTRMLQIQSVISQLTRFLALSATQGYQGTTMFNHQPINGYAST